MLAEETAQAVIAAAAAAVAVRDSCGTEPAESLLLRCIIPASCTGTASIFIIANVQS